MTETKLYPGINEFNRKPSKLMHIDLNSCFASIEQQANPKLRGLPTVVAAYPTDGGCILAASVEAKKLGIKTGMRVKEARNIYRDVKVLPPDPPKYRYIHQQMMKVFETYTPNVEPKSIDEAVLEFREFAESDSACGNPQRERGLALSESFTSDRQRPQQNPIENSPLRSTALEIKHRIKSEIGEWLTVSIGLGPNRFLAKTAASIKKPDGLEEINYLNVEEQLKRLELIDLCGINKALKLRLNFVGIFTPVEFLHADFSTLKTAFKSVGAYHWYKKLRGFETDGWRSSRKSIGHSYALPNKTFEIRELSNILYRLCEKVGRRLRNNKLEANGININIVYKDWIRDNHSHKLSQPVFASMDIYHEALKILATSLKGNKVRNLAVSVFDLSQSLYQQPTLFETPGVQIPDLTCKDPGSSGSLALIRKKSLTRALDEINNKYGEFTITPAPLIDFRKKILDRISFGGIVDMETVI